ncbi:imidazolonepropionase [soil metagenome]
MPLLLKNISQLITCESNSLSAKRGKAQSDIGELNNVNVFISEDKIDFVGSDPELKKFLTSYFHPLYKSDSEFDLKYYNEIDCTNKVVTPGFIDSHTHLVFAGSRSDEYEMRIAGKTYEEIAAAGGGIASTVAAVRNASKEELLSNSYKRLKKFLQCGTTSLEAKSGYGLDTENELKLLEVIKEVGENNSFGADILPTFLGAHSIPKEFSKNDYMDLICNEMIPKVSEKKFAVFIDVFCEMNYFTKEDTERILKCGKSFGLTGKIHTDQFNSIGGVDAAINSGAISVDHLEVLNDADIAKLSNTDIIATLLPGVSYFLNISYPPARKLIESSVPVVLGTDFNPGSCMTENLQTIMSLASVKLKMTSEEILNAVTFNAACALNIQHRTGSIQAGMLADILIFDVTSYKDIVYNFGVNNIQHVIKKGKVLIDLFTS